MENHPDCDLKVSEVRVRLAKDPKKTLIGWASCVINDCLYLNNIAIRRLNDNRLVISFPIRKQPETNKEYFYFKALTYEAAMVLQTAIVGELILLEQYQALERGERHD